MNIYNYKSTSLAFKDIDMKQGIVTGYFASFNTVDAENDIIMPGAFTKTITENFARIKHLLDHNIQKVVGKLGLLKEDVPGLYYESKSGTHAQGRDFLLMAESGIITEHSFGYQIPRGKSFIKDGIRTITEVKMFEGSSLQAWGMNQNTPLTGIKSLFADPEAVQKRIKALDKFCQSTDATDETIELLLIEVKQLSQLLVDLQTTTPAAEKAQEPVSKIDAGLVLAYLSL